MATSPDDVTVSSRFPFETNTTMGETPARQLDFYQAMADFRQVLQCIKHYEMCIILIIIIGNDMLYFCFIIE